MGKRPVPAAPEGRTATWATQLGASSLGRGLRFLRRGDADSAHRADLPQIGANSLGFRIPAQRSWRLVQKRRK